MAPPVAGYIAWYDASDAGSITSSGGAVSQWDDLSASGYDVTQTTESYKPTTGTRTQNSLNVLDFSGTNQHLWRAATSWTEVAVSTVFVVAQSDLAASETNLFDGQAGAGYRTLIREDSGGTFSRYAGTTVRTFGSADTNPHVLVATFTGDSSANGWLDGVAGTASDAGDDTLDGIVIGGNYARTTRNWNGWVAEIIIYDSVLSDTDRKSVEAYLGAKWGIALLITGTAAGAATSSGTASGTITVLGTAAGAATSSGTASGTVTVIGTAAGAATSSGTASATVSKEQQGGGGRSTRVQRQRLLQEDDELLMILGAR